MTELHQRHVEGVNPDDVEIPHIVDNDNIGEVLVNNNDNINYNVRNDNDNNAVNINNENMNDNQDEVHAYEMISRFPYSYAKYSLTIFKVANITSPINVFLIDILYVDNFCYISIVLHMGRKRFSTILFQIVFICIFDIKFSKYTNKISI